MKTMLFRSLLCTGALCVGGLSPLGGCVSPAAHAAPSGAARSSTIVRSVQVDLSDLDLSKPRDVRTMRRRIDRAARDVCGPPTYSAVPEPESYLGYDICYRRALAGALARVHSALVARAALPAAR